MKKIITIFCSVLIVLFIVCILFSPNCNTVTSANNTQTTFIRIADTGDGYIVYNKKTKVMYWISSGLNNAGTATVLVNSDGTPTLYEGEE